MRRSMWGFICILLISIVGGCAGTTKISRMEVLDKYAAISKLDQRIAHAKSNEVYLYAPEGYEKATTKLRDAVNLAQENKKNQANDLADQGVALIAEAEKNTDKSKKIMWEISDYRNKAIKAGAPDLFKDAYAEAEDLFKESTTYIEHGKEEKAKENHPELINMYNKLEKDALEKGIVELAKISKNQAVAAEADDYAPKYFQRAQNELNLALTILESDRTRTAKANEHAKLASKLFKNASQIAELAKTFKRRDFSREDTILWYWNQLEQINHPFGDELDFQQPNHIVVASVQKKIVDLQGELEKSTADAKTLSKEAQDIAKKQQSYIEKLQKDHHTELTALQNEMYVLMKKYKQEISEQKQLQAEQKRKEREAKQKFSYIQSLFAPTEAQVFRKGDSVLISTHGFHFPSGKAEILSSNFGLLNKLMNAINQFPTAKIEISGHTDSVGKDDLNYALSEKRAKNVADFLINVGNINAARITSKGYGETKPVASNDTAEGREKNRRIEVMIINDQQL